MTASVETVTCPCCGEDVYPHRIDSNGDCGLCNYWRSQINRGGGVVVAGHHYRICQEPSAGDLVTGARFYGFGGQRFLIRFTDGREVVTHNLMHQGEVPPRWQGQLSDNAEFIR